MKSVEYFAIFLFITGGAPFAQSKDFVTDLCEANKGNEFIAQVDACITLEKADFLTKIFDSDIHQATCDLLSNEVNFILIQYVQGVLILTFFRWV